MRYRAESCYVYWDILIVPFVSRGKFVIQFWKIKQFIKFWLNGYLIFFHFKTGRDIDLENLVHVYIYLEFTLRTFFKSFWPSRAKEWIFFLNLELLKFMKFWLIGCIIFLILDVRPADAILCFKHEIRKHIVRFWLEFYFLYIVDWNRRVADPEGLARKTYIKDFLSFTVNIAYSIRSRCFHSRALWHNARTQSRVSYAGPSWGLCLSRYMYTFKHVLEFRCIEKIVQKIWRTLYIKR